MPTNKFLCIFLGIIVSQYGESLFFPSWINQPITINTDYFSTWSEWSNSSIIPCQQIRHRECNVRKFAVHYMDYLHFQGSNPLSEEVRRCLYRHIREIKFSACSQMTPVERSNTFVVDLDKYENWLNWSVCHPMECVQSRIRFCRNEKETEESQTSKKVSKYKSKPCPHIFIKEKMKCMHNRECQAYWTNRQRPPLPEKSLPLSLNCGLQSKEIQFSARFRRVIGGHESIPNNWPWHVGIVTRFLKVNSGKFYPCGGTIIHPQWVLTAAHCIYEKGFPGFPLNHLVALKSRGNNSEGTSPLWIRIGDHDRSTRDKEEKDIEVSHVILHPRFSLTSSVISYDQALLRLNTPVTDVQPACLPAQSSYKSRIQKWSECYVIGWGRTKAIKVEPRHAMAWIWDVYNRNKLLQQTTTAPIFAQRLQQVKVPLASLSDCMKDLREDNLNYDAHVCAGRAGLDTCQGDSGGGLFCRSKQQSSPSPWNVIAITSFGAGCGHYKSVYAKVDVDWIRRTILV